MRITGLQRYLLIFTLFLSTSLFAQEGTDIPVYYFNQFNATITSNPSAIIDTSKIELGTFYSSFTGPFSKIKNFEAYCFYRPSTKASWLIEVNSDQQGPVFQKNKIYAGHLQNIFLNNTLRLQMGTKLGVANYFFKPSQSGVGGSDYGLDGSVSLSLYSNKWLIGSAWQQFASTTIQPIDQVYTLNDYWEVMGYYLWDNPNFSIKSGLRSRLSSIQNSIQLSSQVEYTSFLAGGSISNLGFSISGGFMGAPLNTYDHKMLISFLYYVPYNTNLKSINQKRLELILKVFISGE